ncbi:MAG: hypothetical protein M3N47_14835 [Chloroflexota bacterium]|nr:hypothetical protein [Chloroflexota bacterium]
MSTRFDRRHRRIVRMVAAVAAVAGLALPASASANLESGTSALCTVRLPSVEITPPFEPLVLTASSGTITSHGPTGSVSCSGEIGGAAVTGTGTAAIHYTRHGNCAAHVSTNGRVIWKIPTEHGDKELAGSLQVTRIGLNVLAHLEFADARGDFVGALYPRKGDCLLTPLSQVGVVVTGYLGAR